MCSCNCPFDHSSNTLRSHNYRENCTVDPALVLSLGICYFDYLISNPEAAF